MRITDAYISEHFVAGLQYSLGKLNDINEKIVTGREINKPSDSPEKAGRLISIRDSLTNNSLYRANVDETVKFMEATDTSLDMMARIFNELKTLAVKGTNDSYSQSDRAAMAVDVDNKLKELISLANTQVEGRYIFAGFRTMTKPFEEVMTGTAITDVNYNGDSGLMPEEVYKGEIMNKNVPGDVFKNGAFDMFRGVIDLRDSLNANNTSQIQNAINAMGASLDKIIEYRTDIGAKLKRAENISGRITETEATLTKLEAKLSDVDMPDVISAFTLQQNVYQAAIKSISSILEQTTLADILR